MKTDAEWKMRGSIEARLVEIETQLEALQEMQDFDPADKRRVLRLKREHARLSALLREGVGA